MSSFFDGWTIPSWTVLIAAFGIVWLLQIAGTAWQMKHYQAVMGDIIARWKDGAVGVGNSRSRFGKGLILIIVVSPDEIVRDVRLMEGRSIFARFRQQTQYHGLSLKSLVDNAPAGKAGKGFKAAAGRALEQIARAQNNAANSGTSTEGPDSKEAPLAAITA